MRLCSIDGCDRRHNAKGYCVKHYKQLILKAPARLDETRARQRSSTYLSAYGITGEQADDMLASQGFQCAICARALPCIGKGHGQLDHCHTSGKVRGVLCAGCNTGLGHYEAKADRFAAYLLR